MCLKYIFRLIRKYNVEPVFFCVFFARSMYSVTPFVQLLTDKICRNSYHQEQDFCYYLNEPQYKDTNNATLILKDVNNYVLYQNLLTSIPSILATIFIGPWLDKHTIAPKLVLYATTFSGLVEVAILIMNCLFFEAHVSLILVSSILSSMMGGMTILMTAAFTIATRETSHSERTFRFMILELFMVLPGPIGGYITSYLLPLNPWLVSSQTRNYIPCLLIAFISYTICLLFIIFFVHAVRIKESDESIQETTSLRSALQSTSQEYLTIKNNNANDPNNNHSGINDNNHINNGYQKDENLDSNNNCLDSEVKPVSSSSATEENVAKQKGMLESLFQLDSATAMFRSCIKKRESGGHVLLWLIISIYVIDLICLNGMSAIGLQFVIKVYGMSSTEFLQVESIYQIVFGAVTTLLIAFLHKINFPDTLIILIGLFNLFFMNFFRGIILNVTGFYLSYVFGTSFLCTIIACRGFVSKIIPENETGTVLGVLSVFYSTTPVFGSIYTQIYNATIDYNPGIVFLVGSGIAVITILMNLYLHFYYKKYKAKMDRKKLENSQRA